MSGLILWRLFLTGVFVLGVRAGWHYMGRLIENIDAGREARISAARNITPR